MLSQDITESLLAVIMLQLVSILSYRFALWVEGSIQMWPHCILKIAYCYGLTTRTFGRTLWTDVDQTFTICTPLLMGHDADASMEMTWDAGQPRSSLLRHCRRHHLIIVGLNREDVSGQSTDQITLCNVIVCVGRYGHTVANCRSLAVYQSLSDDIQWPSLR